LFTNFQHFGRTWPKSEIAIIALHRHRVAMRTSYTSPEVLKLPAGLEADAPEIAAHPLSMLTPPEVALLLKTTVRGLEAMRARGEGPPWLSLGRSRVVRYQVCQVLQWLRARTQDGKPAAK
jgi:hypothetical protein